MANNSYTLNLNTPKLPMTEDIENLNLDDHIVAFVDLLGIKKLIKNEQQNEALKNIFNLYNQAISTFSTMENVMDIKNFKMKIFSDNILLALKLNKTYSKSDLIDALYNIIWLVRHFQWYALLSGYTLKGGISKDKLFINDVFTYGKALLNAYELESENAIFPRIILDSELLEEVEYSNGVLGYLKKDIDGFYYVDYLSQLFSGTCNGILSQIQKTIIYLAQQKTDKKVKQKYYWLINYFNEGCVHNFSKFFIDLKTAPKYSKREVQNEPK